MRYFLALFLLFMAPIQAIAFSAMQLDDCMAAWQAGMAGQNRKVTLGVSKDGWCQVSDPLGVSFDLIEWRTEGMEGLLLQPQVPSALIIRITDADMIRRLGLGAKPDAPAMPMQITVVLRENALAKQLLIENLLITGPKGNVVSLRGVFYDVDLSSPAKMQLSLGSAKLRDVVLVGVGNRELEPYLRPYIGDTFPERSRRRSSMIDKVAEWPNHSFPPETKHAVKQLIATLPAPNGTLRVEVDTGGGVSVGIFVPSLMFGESTKGLVAMILESTVFHAEWIAAE